MDRRNCSAFVKFLLVHPKCPLSIKICSSILCLLVFACACYGQQADDKKRKYQQEAEYLLFQFNDQVKAIDEPTLRIFLRLRYATLLWSGKVGGASEKAEAATADAIDDFSTNQKDLVPLYQNVFHRDLLALLYLHCPQLAKKYENFVDSTRPSYDVAYSMLNAKDGSGPAVKLIERSLSNGEGLGIESIFFLTKLEKEQPALVLQILYSVLNTAMAQPGNHLLESLCWLQSFYLKPDRPDDLKLRFLSLVVEVTSNIELISDAKQTSYAYDLLSQTLPEIERLLPSKYPQAQGQLMYLTAAISKDRTAGDGVQERIRKSEDPLQQTITEAHSAQNTALRDDLLIQAAQMALDKGKLQLAMDLAKDASDEKAIQTWRQEFFSDLAGKAIKENKPTFAEKVSLEIGEPLRRATVLQDIALFYRKFNDSSRSRQILFDSLKQINLAENDSLKAVAFLKTANVFKEVDQSMTLSLVQSAVEVTDRFLFDQEGTRDGHIDFTFEKTNTVAVAWHLIPIVQSLVRTNGDTMLGWINSVHNHGMKASALFGASVEMFELAQKNPATRQASSATQKRL